MCVTLEFLLQLNDKIIAKFSKFLNSIEDSKLLENCTFNFFERLSDSSKVEITYQGA